MQGIGDGPSREPVMGDVQRIADELNKNAQTIAARLQTVASAALGHEPTSGETKDLKVPPAHSWLHGTIRTLQDAAGGLEAIDYSVRRLERAYEISQPAEPDRGLRAVR